MRFLSNVFATAKRLAGKNYTDYTSSDQSASLTPFDPVEECIFFSTNQGQFTRSCFASGAQTDIMIATDLNRDGKPIWPLRNPCWILSHRMRLWVFHQ